jgi:L-lactate dehydrogenase complex protein LldG
MPDRENILHKVRTALGHHGSRVSEPPAPPRLIIPSWDREERLARLMQKFSGETVRCESFDEARDFIAARVAGRSAVATNHPLLETLGITSLPNVRSGLTSHEEIRDVCAESEIGITGVDYALADPPALVMLSSPRNDRLTSLLPSSHIAVVEADQILTGLDVLFTIVPDPAEVSSSMVLIGGPSRTGDIEMLLTLGVHGPREVCLVIV